VRFVALRPLFAISTVPRLVSLNEDGGFEVCVEVDQDGGLVLDANGNVVQVPLRR